MRHEHFNELLSHAVVLEGRVLTAEDKKGHVRVQWDPERTPNGGVLSYRSIQIGVGPGIVQQWVNEWIDCIEDVTEKAARLKSLVDDGSADNVEELRGTGLMPDERVYDVSEKL